jgi:hypothetical protein
MNEVARKIIKETPSVFPYDMEKRKFLSSMTEIEKGLLSAWSNERYFYQSEEGKKQLEEVTRAIINTFKGLKDNASNPTFLYDFYGGLCMKIDKIMNNPTHTITPAGITMSRYIAILEMEEMLTARMLEWMRYLLKYSDEPKVKKQPRNSIELNKDYIRYELNNMQLMLNTVAEPEHEGWYKANVLPTLMGMLLMYEEKVKARKVIDIDEERRTLRNLFTTVFRSGKLNVEKAFKKIIVDDLFNGIDRLMDLTANIDLNTKPN